MADDELSQEDIAFEISFYEGTLAKHPDFVAAMVALGDLYTKNGQYVQGLAVDQRLAQIRPDDPYVFYNLACSYSLMQDVDEALIAIQQAVKCGYDDVAFLEQDEDLKDLRADPRFIKFWKNCVFGENK